MILIEWSRPDESQAGSSITAVRARQFGLGRHKDGIKDPDYEIATKRDGEKTY